MDDDLALLNTVGAGATLADLMSVLAQFPGDARVGLFPMTGGGCRLAIIDADGDAFMYVWYDL